MYDAHPNRLSAVANAGIHGEHRPCRFSIAPKPRRTRVMEELQRAHALALGEQDQAVDDLVELAEIEEMTDRCDASRPDGVRIRDAAEGCSVAAAIGERLRDERSKDCWPNVPGRPR